MAFHVSTLVLSSPLLAAGAGILQSPTARLITWCVGIICVLGLAWGASVLSDSLKQKKQRVKKAGPAKKPGNVFDEICAAHALSSGQKRHLLSGAAALKLDSPAMLFVDSALLNELGGSEHENAGEFRTLADRLFPPESETAESDQPESGSSESELSEATATA